MILKRVRSPWLLFLPIGGLYHKQDISVRVTSLVHNRVKLGQGVLNECAKRPSPSDLARKRGLL